MLEKTTKYLMVFIVAFLPAVLRGELAMAAGVQRSPEWDKTVEAAKKEGKIVIAIPPEAQLRREMEVVLKQKLGLETELMPNPGPKNASRIAAEKKAGVNYFDALIVGTGTAVGLARDGMLEPLEGKFAETIFQ